MTAKRIPLNMRATPELRHRIEEAARQSGLSMSQEVERRLISTFDGEDVRSILRTELAPLMQKLGVA